MSYFVVQHAKCHQEEKEAVKLCAAYFLEKVH